MRAARGFAVLALAGLLAACGRAPVRDADLASLERQAARETSLAAQDAWSMSGKIAVSDGRDGGSGRIDWRQDGERYRIEIRAPVTRRTFRLTGGPEGATLEGLDGGPRSGPDAEALLQEATGWRVPVADMVAWARGARGQGGAALDVDADGRPAVLRQRGWTVEYRAWDAGDPPMPKKVFARNGERRVRLAVERWDGG